MWRAAMKLWVVVGFRDIEMWRAATKLWVVVGSRDIEMWRAAMKLWVVVGFREDLHFNELKHVLVQFTTDLDNICSVAAGSCFWAVSNVALVFVWYFQKFWCVLLKVILCACLCLASVVSGKFIFSLLSLWWSFFYCVTGGRIGLQCVVGGVQLWLLGWCLVGSAVSIQGGSTLVVPNLLPRALW